MTVIQSQPADPFAMYLTAQRTRLEQLLATMLPPQWQVPNVLRQSVDYSLLAGGKRLRPLCVLLACESLHGQAAAVEPTACAVEMIHTYSLIHDDLPALDNDDYRRGKRTSHKVYGEAIAILAGDGLLTHAFHTLVQGTRQLGVPGEVILTIVEELAEYAGVSGMVGGQVADMLGQQGTTTIEQLEYIHLRKTSDLIVCSLRAGGRIAGATEAQLQALTLYGTKLGLAFQIQDDILDVVGDEAVLGKTKGSDRKGGKVTYPFFIGVQASQQKVEQLTQEAKQAIRDTLFPSPAYLLQFADYLMRRSH